MRRRSTREWGAVAVAVVAVAGAAALLAVYAPRWWEDDGATSAPRAITARGLVEPATSLFGDLVTLRADVLVDPQEIEPESVRVEARFTPFRLVSQTRRVHDLGGRAARIEYAFGVQCLSAACVRAGVRRDTSGAVRTTPIPLRRARVVALRRAGPPTSAPLAWPAVVVQSRLTPRMVDEGEPQVGAFPTPPRTYSMSADLAGALLLLGGLMSALGGGYLLVRVVRGRRVVPRLRLPAHLTPLDRAVALVRDASANGDVARERKALERLAVELRRHKDRELAEAAGRLAWSAGRPPRAAVDDLIATVSRSADGR